MTTARARTTTATDGPGITAAAAATSSAAVDAGYRHNTAVPRLVRRPGAVGIALAAWDIWRRLPPKQRKMVLDAARKQGPKIAAAAVQARANRKNRKKP
jgi:hypothetical protein